MSTVFFFIILLRIIFVFAADTDLIIGNVAEQHVSALSENLVVTSAFHRFDSVSDGASLLNAIGNVESELKIVQDLIIKENKNRIVIRTKNELKESIDKLHQATAKLQELQTDVLKLTEKSILLQDHISKNMNEEIKPSLKRLKKNILPDESKSLRTLVKELECSYQQMCIDDDFKIAQKTFFEKVIEVGDTQLKCDDFTEDCVESYKTILGTFEDYQINHIAHIRGQLKSLKQAGCKSEKKSRKAIGKQVKALEKRVEGWVSTVKSKLKKLIENKMTRLSQKSLFNCERLNELRIASKDHKNNKDRLIELKDDMNALLKTSETNYHEFNEAYDRLIEFQPMMKDKLFDKCFEKASEVFYVVVGFKKQTVEYISRIEKRLLVVDYENSLNEYEARFNKFVLMFESELQYVKTIPLTKTCGRVTDLKKKFGETLQAELNVLRGNLGDLQHELEEDKLKVCKEYELYKNQVNIFVRDMTTYANNNRYQTDFFGIFHTSFCEIN